MKIAMRDFTRDPADGVFKHPRTGEFNYSDGDEAERRVLSIAAQARDLGTSSAELRGQINDWITEYHFGQARHNLLRHVQFRPMDRILELGCGCGSITRQLGESGAHITAVEGSLSRAQAAAARCRDLDNVQVYCANFQDVDFSVKFDIVTLIGVLEYSPQYSQSADPIGETIQMARDALSDGGVLIIAIENQLGLKYLSGYTEDHVAKAYYGVEDRYRKQEPVTFGRKALDGKLAAAGFRDIVFNFPFPDYKIPRVVFTEKAFETPAFIPEEIIRQIPDRDYSYPGLKPPMNPRLSVPVVCRNGLMADLANSFLVFATVKASRIFNLYAHNLLAASYASNRARVFNTRTEFVEDDGKIVVRKFPLFPQFKKSHDPAHVLVHNIHEVPYVAGVNLEAEIYRCIETDELEELGRLLSTLIVFIENEGIERLDPQDRARSIIKPDFVDCIPSNVILQGGRAHYIDREWTCVPQVSLGVLLLRIVDSVTALSGSRPDLNREALIATLAAGGYRIDEEIRRDYDRLISAIDSLVYGGRGVLEVLEEIPSDPLPELYTLEGSPSSCSGSEREMVIESLVKLVQSMEQPAEINPFTTRLHAHLSKLVAILKGGSPDPAYLAGPNFQGPASRDEIVTLHNLRQAMTASADPAFVQASRFLETVVQKLSVSAGA